MALTLRPTDLERSPATAHLEDWIVLDNGKPIGRIYQRHAPANADVVWFWSITSYVEPRAGLRTSGTTGTLDAAKAAFRATCSRAADGQNFARRISEAAVGRRRLACSISS